MILAGDKLNDYMLLTEGGYEGWIVFHHPSGPWMLVKEADELDKVMFRTAELLQDRLAKYPLTTLPGQKVKELSR